jgi:AraC-like DNA-binding protein
MSAVIVFANHHAFRAGEALSFSSVESRMLLWSVGGEGQVRINGARHRVAPGDFFFLPWRHAISYKAAKSDPFVLGGIHVIPRHARGSSIAYAVAHEPGHPLYASRARRDARLPGLEGVLYGAWGEDDALRHLCEYIVLWFARGTHDDVWACRLAEALLAELTVALRAGIERRKLPDALRRIEVHVRARLTEPFALGDLAKIAHVSPSTLIRMFHKHAGETPIRWLTRTRVGHAARLLATTRLTAGAVGEACGIADPYYFSKVFKRTMGVTARAYRRAHALL